MEAEAESSASEDEKEEEEEEEPVSRGSMMGGNSALPNPARCYTAADVAAANAAWDLYKARNNSVVVDTFQGQFKSTVSVWCGWVRACVHVFMHECDLFFGLSPLLSDSLFVVFLSVSPSFCFSVCGFYLLLYTKHIFGMSCISSTQVLYHLSKLLCVLVIGVFTIGIVIHCISDIHKRDLIVDV